VTVPETTNRVRVPHEGLLRSVTGIFEALGFRPDDAATSADVLVTADLRGIESHGVSNMLRIYVDWVADGHVNPRAEPTKIADMACTAAYEADSALGITVLPALMREAMDRAARYGVGMISVRNARHSGMMAYHSMLPLEHDLIGVACTSAGPRVIPTFGREPRLGTNPISVAVPTADDRPFVFDAATSAVAFNKIANARRAAEPLGAGWCADAEGRPMTEPTPSEQPVDARMLPLGATPDGGSHKGYALAAIVEVLGSILPGGVYLGRLGRGFSGHFLAAINPAGFGDPDEFKREMSAFTTYLRETPPAAGQERVLVPNDLEYEQEQQRRATGVPLHEDVLAWLDETCERLGAEPIPR
jgi:L-2-hydroxycarboxylate dehydrogenase (NAD+)